VGSIQVCGTNCRWRTTRGRRQVSMCVFACVCVSVLYACRCVCEKKFYLKVSSLENLHSRYLLSLFFVFVSGVAVQNGHSVLLGRGHGQHGSSIFSKRLHLRHLCSIRRLPVLVKSKLSTIHTKAPPPYIGKAMCTLHLAVRVKYMQHSRNFFSRSLLKDKRIFISYSVM
jgi:hypothetical protein